MLRPLFVARTLPPAAFHRCRPVVNHSTALPTTTIGFSRASSGEAAACLLLGAAACLTPPCGVAARRDLTIWLGHLSGEIVSFADCMSARRRHNLSTYQACLATCERHRASLQSQFSDRLRWHFVKRSAAVCTLAGLVELLIPSTQSAMPFGLDQALLAVCCGAVTFWCLLRLALRSRLYAAHLVCPYHPRAALVAAVASSAPFFAASVAIGASCFAPTELALFGAGFLAGQTVKSAVLDTQWAKRRWRLPDWTQCRQM